MPNSKLSKPKDELISFYNKKGILIKVVSISSNTNKSQVIYYKKSKFYKLISSIKRRFKIFGKRY